MLLVVLCATPAAVHSAPGEASSASSSSSLARAALSTELATLAHEGDALRLWQRATASAAEAVVEALRRQDAAHSVQLKDIGLEVRAEAGLCYGCPREQRLPVRFWRGQGCPLLRGCWPRQPGNLNLSWHSLSARPT